MLLAIASGLSRSRSATARHETNGEASAVLGPDPAGKSPELTGSSGGLHACPPRSWCSRSCGSLTAVHPRTSPGGGGDRHRPAGVRHRRPDREDGRRWPRASDLGGGAKIGVRPVRAMPRLLSMSRSSASPPDPRGGHMLLVGTNYLGWHAPYDLAITWRSPPTTRRGRRGRARLAAEAAASALVGLDRPVVVYRRCRTCCRSGTRRRLRTHRPPTRPERGLSELADAPGRAAGWAAAFLGLHSWVRLSHEIVVRRHRTPSCADHPTPRSKDTTQWTSRSPT